MIKKYSWLGKFLFAIGSCLFVAVLFMPNPWGSWAVYAGNVSAGLCAAGWLMDVFARWKSKAKFDIAFLILAILVIMVIGIMTPIMSAAAPTSYKPRTL